MRAPLILLILIYAIAILGLTLIPGVDAEGRPAPPLSIFHAFYFISYTATTIGFGEIPQAFSNGQRLWVIVCIYMSVVGWSYSILTLLALVQDSGFQQALSTARFIWRVRRMGESFLLICGCGETGSTVIRALDRQGRRFVVLESSRQRVEELDLEDFKTDTPALHADARLPENLLLAGLRHPRCQGVLALTNSDEANLAIAIAVRLLNPSIPVLARAEQQVTVDNLASFGTNHIINPFERFADYLALAVHAPACYQLVERLTGTPGQRLPSPLPIPPRGRWIICGYGRFGRAVAQRFAAEGLDYSIIDPKDIGEPGHLQIIGTGTEAAPLKAAGLEQAAGIVVGTENDVNNLSIAMTAKAIHPELFVVMRQNQIANSVLFEAFKAQINMVPSRIVAMECLALLNTPLLDDFLRAARQAGEVWAQALNQRLAQRFADRIPETWNVRINAQEARAVYLELMHGGRIVLADLSRRPDQREAEAQLLPLLLRRQETLMLLPEPDTPIEPGDWLLFAGSSEARRDLRLALFSEKVLRYLCTGKTHTGGWLWRRLTEPETSQT
ncbi:MAG: NAD-binding protein [Azovibrio sp.]|nr:NAD-binding protein [Azovibrio sp.]